MFEHMNLIANNMGDKNMWIPILIFIAVIFIRILITNNIRGKAMWKSILVFITVVFVIVMSFGYWFEWRYERISVSGRCTVFVDNYKDYYAKAKDVYVRTLIMRNVVHNKKIYFLPGQKEITLGKIKEDVINDLKTITEENNDIFYKYEISDDFRKVRIYENTNDFDKRKGYELSPKVSNLIGSKIELYSQIKNGQIIGFGIDEGVKFIEDEVEN
jgi:hypothetical protein